MKKTYKIKMMKTQIQLKEGNRTVCACKWGRVKQTKEDCNKVAIEILRMAKWIVRENVFVDNWDAREIIRKSAGNYI